MNSKKLSVSVVIPNYNGKKLLQKNLPKVLAAVNTSEVIVVDDASTDDSIDFLESEYPHITIIKQALNMRFAHTCNAGVAAANGDIVILLNNDVAPQIDFLEPLIEPFRDPTVFAVGAAEITDLQTPELLSGKACGKFCRGFLIHKRCEKQVSGRTLWVSGGSGAFRKSIWNKLGGLDTLYAPAYDEDRDICYRAMKRGYTCLFSAESRVQHIHETTNRNTFGDRKIQLMGYRNQLMFTWKNTTDRLYILNHILWLPYHVIVISFKSKGIFFIALITALKRLPNILSSRKIENGKVVNSDEKVLSMFEN